MMSSAVAGCDEDVYTSLAFGKECLAIGECAYVHVCVYVSLLPFFHWFPVGLG